MKIFKVIGNTIAAIGQTVQDSAELVSNLVGDEGLKHTSRQSFKIINTALDESVEIAILESDWNLQEFKRKHQAKVGRPPKKNESKK